MKILFSFFFLMSVLTSCQKKSSDNTDTQQPVAAATSLNVSYGDDAQQKMDVYLPAGRSADSTKVIVLVHGGSWTSGSKEDFATYIDTFKRRLPHYAIFNLNYRLATSSTIFPTQELDVKTAMEFIAGKASEYGISKEKVAVLGVSAGAHLGLLQAYKYTDPVKVKAVIDMFGPTDLTIMYNAPWQPQIPFLLLSLTGTTPQAKPEVYQQSSPAFFVSASSPPTLILQGGADVVVDKSQSTLLAAKLQAAGVPHQIVIYPNEGHGWFDANMIDSFNRIVAFLETHL